MKPRNDEDFDWQEQVGSKPLRLRPRNPHARLWLGYGVSQMVGIGAFWLVLWLHFVVEDALGIMAGTVLIISQFLLIPVGMGFVSAYFWINDEEVQPTRLSFEGRNLVPHRLRKGLSLLNAFIFCIPLIWIFRGPLIPLPYFPILWGLMEVGLRIGAHFWRTNPLFRA